MKPIAAGEASKNLAASGPVALATTALVLLAALPGMAMLQTGVWAPFIEISWLPYPPMDRTFALAKVSACVGPAVIATTALVLLAALPIMPML
jgi:hypothetical protein